MPIYEYLCNSCGAEEEHLQKMSEDPIAICPECGSSDYIKRVSASGFQLKGSGWYVTDFKNNQSTSKTTSKAASNSVAKGDAVSPAPAPAPTQSSERSPAAD